MTLSSDDVRLLEHELARIGLLLEHDPELASATTLIAGGPIRGSWWGHALGRRIYAALETFADGEGALVLKLVNDKRTYVHRSLWPAVLSLVTSEETAHGTPSSPLAAKLLDLVLEADNVRLDALVASGFATSQALTKAGRELESALRVHASGLHTESGAHTKLYRSWAAWAKEHGVDPAAAPTLARARTSLTAAVERLAAGASRRPKLTLL